MGMGLNIEVIQVEPWPPEKEPPIAGIPEWLGEYWPALVILVAGLGISLAAIFKGKGKK